MGGGGVNLEGNVIILQMVQSWSPEDMWQSSSSNMVSKSGRGLKRSKLSKTNWFQNSLTIYQLSHLLPILISQRCGKGLFHAPFESA